MKLVDFSRLTRVWSAFVVCGVLALASLPAADVLAQSTSADLRGRVLNQGGDPVSGATVVILHVPSGTASEAVTGDSGGFFRSGLRVGGPYQLTVRADGFEVAQEENIFLEPGSQDPLVFTLGELEREMDVIQVIGRKIPSAVEQLVRSATDMQNQPST